MTAGLKDSVNGPLELRPHQEEGIEWLRRTERALLADPPRTGKTAQALLAAEGRTLVVAPAFLDGTWKEQQDLWRPSLDLTFVGYSSLAKRTANDQGRLLKAVPVPRPEFRSHWDTVICDEAHALKNPKANWTKALQSIADRSDRLFLLTGTPIVNWAHELLMMLRLLYPNDRRFTNKERWLTKWFKMEMNHFSKSLKPVIRKSDPNKGLLDCWTWAEFWMENGLDGPDGKMLQRDVDLGNIVTEEAIEVEMTPEQKKVYNALKRDYVAWTDSNAEISAWSDGGLHTKLARVSTSLGLEDPDCKNGSGKFNVLKQILEASGDQPILLFCHFRDTAAALADLCESLGLSHGVIRGGVAYDERDRLRLAFQSGELRVLIGTLATMSEGLTLSQATLLVMVERSWTPYRNKQARMRAQALGKTTHTHIVDLFTTHTVDIGMKRLLELKTSQQVQALTAREFRDVING